MSIFSPILNKVLCFVFEVCKAAMVKMAINLKISRFSHPMNHLDCRSNLVSNQEASPIMEPSSQGHWRSTGNHRLRRDRRIKRDLFFREIEELRQVYNL